MPWFNVDDGMAFHRKVVKAGNAAIGLWARAGAWSAGELTEGFIPDHMIPTMGTAIQAEKLVAVGLWKRVEGGFQFHEWTAEGRNPTREQVLERRRKEREKKAKARAVRQYTTRKSANTQVNEDCPQGTPQGRPGGLPGGLPGGVGSTTPLHSTPLPTKDTFADLSVDGATLLDFPQPDPAPKRNDYPADFEAAWTAYGRKGAKRTAYAEWQRAVKRAPVDRITAAIPPYVAATPDTRYRKDFERWLKGDAWESALPRAVGGHQPYSNPDPADYHEDL